MHSKSPGVQAALVQTSLLEQPMGQLSKTTHALPAELHCSRLLPLQLNCAGLQKVELQVPVSEEQPYWQRMGVRYPVPVELHCSESPLSLQEYRLGEQISQAPP